MSMISHPREASLGLWGMGKMSMFGPLSLFSLSKVLATLPNYCSHLLLFKMDNLRGPIV